MNIFDNIAVYLPKYLSDSSSDALRTELKNFPIDGTKSTIYTSMLNQEEVLFQGDGIASLKIVDILHERFKESPVILLSNTCDMNIDNKRLFNTQICYAPIVDFKKYKDSLYAFLVAKEKESDNISEEEIKKKVSLTIGNHIDDIKKQRITQIFFLPQGGGLNTEGLVFLDRIFNIDSHYIDRSKIKSNRLFTLSDFGLYLLLLKISIHFTRIQEKIDRVKGVIS